MLGSYSILDFVALVIVAVFIWVIVAGLRRFLGNDFYSAFWSPLRWSWHRLVCIKNIPSALGTFVIRQSGWSVLQKLAMGLEAYPYNLSIVEIYPSSLRDDLVEYEDMPKAAEERALAMRGDWIKRNLGHVSETFSNMVVTEADLSFLLLKVEEDQSLVHAAYYSDDECVDRIATWIAK
jgi:hypothetical protein